MQAPVGKTTALPLRLPPIRTSPGSVAVKLSSAALLHTGVEGAAAIAPRGHTVSLLQSGTGSRVQRRSGFRPRPGRALGNRRTTPEFTRPQRPESGLGRSPTPNTGWTGRVCPCGAFDHLSEGGM